MSARSTAEWAASTDWPVLLLPVRLETRRIGNYICIRVFPDQPFVNSHQPALTQDEHDAGLALLNSLPEELDEAVALDPARENWNNLAKLYGSNRAAWILQSLRDNNSDVVADSSGVIPRLFLMPERFVFFLYKNDKLAYTKTGEAIPDTLPLLAAPANDTSPDPPSDGMFDGDSRWINNFDEAVAKGMAVRIQLSVEDAAAEAMTFSQIVAVGIRDGDGAGPDAFNALVHVHHYTDGFEFLVSGAATNNTADGPSAFSQSDKRLADAFDFEVRSPLSRIRPTDRQSTAAGQILEALGQDDSDSLFAHIKGADLLHGATVGRMVHALWPATGDYFVSEMLGYRDAMDERAMLGLHARQYLRPRGNLASIRIGNVPYGVLPVSTIRPWSSTNRWGWKTSALDHPLQRQHDWAIFDALLFWVLTELSALWAQSAEDPKLVPRVGGTNDPEEELIKILGMQPHSVSYRVRPLIDETLVRLIMSMFGGGLFGLLSSAGGLASPEVALNEWINQRETIAAATLELLTSLGADETIELSNLLRVYAWAGGEDLYMPFVRGDAGDDLPDNYLAKLLPPTNPITVDASNTLLYDLLRRSIAREPSAPVDLRGVQNAISELNDLPILEFFSRTVTSADVLRLASREQPVAVSDDDATAVADAINALTSVTIATVSAAISSVVGPTVYNNLVFKLRQDCSPRLESSLRDVLDALTHRLDAWYSTLPMRRLTMMQERSKGFHWGAYGYVEHVSFPTSTTVRGKPANGGGYIHAPSVGQAAAAALLRSAFDFHREESGTGNNPYALDLTSNRTRRALTLLDGVGQGQDLSALLGYMFERALGAAHLEQLIDDFRIAYPIHAPDESDPNQPAEFVPARNVADGVKLVEGYADAFADKPALRSVLSDLTSADLDAVNAALDHLGDACDAVGDTLMLESVFQAVQGNYERSGAALDASAGQGRPPELFALETPFSSKKLRHRVCLMLPSAVPTEAATPGVRAAAEPRLNAWLGEVFGSLSEIGCVANVSDHEPVTITLLDLDPAISAVDFLHMCSPIPTGVGMTEIEQRIRRVIRATDGVAIDATIELKLDETQKTYSLAHAMEFGRAVLDMLGSAVIMRPKHLAHPDDEPVGPFYTALEQQLQRCRDARSKLAALSGLLTPEVPPTTLLSTLDAIAGFGISEAMIESFNDELLDQRRESVRNECTKRLAAADALLPQMGVQPDDTHVQAIVSAFKALFGDAFAVFSTFDISGSEEKTARFDGSSPSAQPAADRVWLWLQQVAETHPRVRKLETFLMMAHAWGSNTNLVVAPTVAQLPVSSTVGWQALSDAELGAPRENGVQSLMAFLPSSFDLATVTGIVADEWTETIPEKDVATGVSFEYDQPGSQAPSGILLATPGNFDEKSWSPQHLAEIVRDTVSLAKIRLVDLDALPEVATAIAPTLMFPIRDAPPTIKLAPPPKIKSVPRFNEERVGVAISPDLRF